jgi:hypothetical protein
MLRSPIRTLRESTQSLAQRSVHLCARFRERMSASVLPISSTDIEGIQEVVMNLRPSTPAVISNPLDTIHDGRHILCMTVII